MGRHGRLHSRCFRRNGGLGFSFNLSTEDSSVAVLYIKKWSLALIGNWRFQRTIADKGDSAWTDALPSGMAGSGKNDALAGGPPDSTTTCVPT